MTWSRSYRRWRIWGWRRAASKCRCSDRGGCPPSSWSGCRQGGGESRERVRGAIAAMGLSLPPKRIVVNLSPADLPKEGSHFDLPIALGLLGAMGVVDAETLARLSSWSGELGLDARIAASPGVLLAAIHAGESGQGAGLPGRAGGGSGLGGIGRGGRRARPAGAAQPPQGRRPAAAARAGRGRGARHSAPISSR